MAAGAEPPPLGLETLLAHKALLAHMVDTSEILQVKRNCLTVWSSALIWKPDNVMMEYSALDFADGDRQCTAATDTLASGFRRDATASLIEQCGVCRKKS